MYSRSMAKLSCGGFRLLVSSYTNRLDLDRSEGGSTLQADCTAVVFLGEGTKNMLDDQITS